MNHDALPLVERDPTPPYGMAPVLRPPVRHWSGTVTLVLVVVASVAAAVAVLVSVG